MNAGAEARFITPSDLIDAGTVAGMLGVDRSTVSRRAQAGTLPVLAQMPNGAYIFDKPDIVRLIES